MSCSISRSTKLFPELLGPTKIVTPCAGMRSDLQASQQRAADQLKALQQSVSSDQAEIIRLSEKVTALTGKVEALQQSFAIAQRAPAPLQPLEPAKQKRVAR